MTIDSCLYKKGLKIDDLKNLIFSDESRKMKLSNGRNKKRKVTTANAYAKGRKPTAKNPSFGTMPTSESAKKDTEKSTAVINQALQAI